MDGYELIPYLNHCENYVAILSADEIVKHRLLNSGEYIIVNTNNSRDSGGIGHWIVIGKGEWFDSAGLRPENYHSFFQEFLLSMGSYFINTKRIQHPSSTTCGLFCIMFITLRQEEKSYQHIINLFSDNLHKNEKRIADFINKRYFN